MKIIGLGHYSRTGKDTFANALVQNLRDRHPNVRVAKIPFAWKLKMVCYELYSWDGLMPPEFYDTPEGEPLREVPLPTIGLTPVQIWVAMGTPAVRDNVWQTTWIDYLLKTDHSLDVLVIPDVRFPNEVQAIKDRGGHIIKVVRPGYGPRKTVADRQLVGFYDWDNLIGADGNISTLREWGRIYADLLATDGGLPGVSAWEIRRVSESVEVIEPWEKAA